QKLLFLFTRKQQKEERPYSFLPYHYGCFSFTANNDIQVLIKNGYLLKLKDNNDKDYYKINSEFSNYISELNLFDQGYLRNIKKEFSNFSQEDIIRYTYENYPFFAINSKIAKDILTEEGLQKVEKQKRHIPETQLFTIGYEGLSLEEYINKLLINDVRLLCDVRKNAYSQKYGFSKAVLAQACEGANIHYEHIPELGIVSDKRQNLQTQKDYDILFEEYERTTLKDNNDALLKVRDFINKYGRIALTCFEKDPKQCHRSRVAKALINLPDIDYTLKEL
ncbi:MAG: DUF488 domain-containing protein, partial [Bacteroidales bacterium]|nr:DUF488 domain-containing protein [Bacteroidales bacterium]